jgi:hypothetical protein
MPSSDDIMKRLERNALHISKENIIEKRLLKKGLYA